MVKLPTTLVDCRAFTSSFTFTVSDQSNETKHRRTESNVNVRCRQFRLARVLDKAALNAYLVIMCVTHAK